MGKQTVFGTNHFALEVLHLLQGVSEEWHLLVLQLQVPILCVCARVCTCVCVHACMCVCVCVYVCMCACGHVCAKS